ncbi:murein biosynthesis integral membrane protein MurJ [Pelagibacteraceae bacterium]|jgi:putative peptidoglycan lipid II flippase|nr:murein biosynthesis integral membrane protein MurJ [Pelagibacteraceae bacterium]MDC1158339.1 murein biosynthesis integral membrane protein MurJ [Pelagibacteraceae bacterium]
MNLLSSTSIFSFFTLMSRILGYFRDILIAFFLGASISADAFFVAFRLPNTFRRLFSEGTFNAAFIPSYTSAKIASKKKGKKFADDILGLLLLILIIIVTIVEIFTPYFVSIIAPGFTDNDLKFSLAVELTRVTFPFLFFVSLSSFFSGILNSNNKFGAAAAAPIILNIILILSLIISYKFNLNFTKQLSYGVTIAGVLQLIFLFFVTLKFYSPTLNFTIKADSKVKLFFRKLIPSIFSSGVTQINILIGTIIASFEAGAVSYLYYADRIYQINLAIAGIAVGTVSLPVLSKAFKNKNLKKLSNIQSKSFELSLLLSIPASIGLILASEEIVNALFGYGSFSEEDVKFTADALKYFGFGVPAFALIKILSNFFFARDNTKIPFYISILMVIINVSISVSLFKNLGFIIIPIATSIATWIGVLFYLYLLKQKNFLLFNNQIIPNFLKILISTIIMSFILVVLLNVFAGYLNYAYKFKAIYLISIVGFTGIVYLLSCYLIGILKKKNYKAN